MRYASNMTNREIVLQLALLMLLLLAGGAFYAYQKSSAMVPVLIRYLDSDDFRERQAATARLQELGHEARAAVPRLLALTTNPRSSDVSGATVALSRIDLTAARVAMASAQTALHSPDVAARPRAAGTLGSLGLFARPAVAALIIATHDDDAMLRDRAVTALASIGAPAELIIPALVAALDDPVYHVRYAAVVAFDLLPAVAAVDALPALQHLAHDTNQMVQSRAGYAIQRIQTAHPLAIELSVSRYMLARGHQSRMYTLHKLAVLGAQAESLVPDLVTLLDAPEDIVRYATMETLAAMGPAARSSAPALRARLADREPVNRDAARYALQRMGEKE